MLPQGYILEMATMMGTVGRIYILRIGGGHKEFRIALVQLWVKGHPEVMASWWPHPTIYWVNVCRTFTNGHFPVSITPRNLFFKIFLYRTSLVAHSICSTSLPLLWLWLVPWLGSVHMTRVLWQDLKKINKSYIFS